MSDKQDFLRLMRSMGVEVSGETSSVLVISSNLNGDPSQDVYLTVFEFDETGKLDSHWIERQER